MNQPAALVLLGSSPTFPALLEWTKATGIKGMILTSPDQAPELKALGLDNFETVENFKINERGPLPTPDDMTAISFGARWIFSAVQLKELFGNRLLNAHGARLPFDRGGGGFSWRIMRGDRIGCLLLHRVDGGIDTGPIVASEDYVIPRSLQTPAEIGADYECRQTAFVIDYLERGSPMASMGPPAIYASTYYPRLHTPTHAWIDWSWPPEEIERFILAFDDPYPGARTHWRNGMAILKKVQMHRGEVPHHSFQTGIVIRNNRKWLTIALSGSGCLLIEDARDEHGNELIHAIKEGDRLFTPPEVLTEALKNRMSIDSTGFRVYR